MGTKAGGASRPAASPKNGLFARRSYLLLAGLLGVLGAGCSSGQTHRITMSGGSMGGGWSAISEGVVGTLRRAMPDVAITQEIGLDGANAVIVNSGRVQLGLLHSAMGHLAIEGEYPYSEKLNNLRAISRVYADSAYHFVVRADTGLHSIEEIKEKKYPLRVSVIYKGSLMELASQALFEAYGISYQDIESWGGRVYFRAVSPSVELMKEDRLDAIGLTVQFPETNINEGSLRTDFRLLPISDEAIEYVNRRLGTYRSVIPGGIYRFAPDDIPTFSDVCVLTAYAGLPEQEAYDITRALYQDLDYLHTVHRSLSKLQATDLPLVNQLPLHPGAARFYREAGLL